MSVPGLDLGLCELQATRPIEGSVWLCVLSITAEKCTIKYFLDTLLKNGRVRRYRPQYSKILIISNVLRVG